MSSLFTDLLIDEKCLFGTAVFSAVEMRSVYVLALSLAALFVAASFGVASAQTGDCQGLSCGNRTILIQVFEHVNCTGASVVTRSSAVNECKLVNHFTAPRYELIRTTNFGYEKVIFFPSATSCDLSDPTQTVSIYEETRTGYCVPLDSTFSGYASRVVWKDAEEMVEANIAPFEPTPEGADIKGIVHSGDGYDCDRRTGCGAGKPTRFTWNNAIDCGEKKLANSVIPFMGFTVFGECYEESTSTYSQTNIKISCEDDAVLTTSYSSTCDNEAGVMTIEKQLANVCVRTGPSSSTYIFCPTASVTKAPNWKASDEKAPTSNAATLTSAIASFVALIAALVVA